MLRGLLKNLPLNFHKIS